MHNRDLQFTLQLFCVAILCFITSKALASAQDYFEENNTHVSIQQLYDQIKQLYIQGKKEEGNHFADQFMKSLPLARPQETMLSMCWLAECFLISGQPNKVKNLLAVDCYQYFLQECVLETKTVFPYIAWSSILHCAGLFDEADRCFNVSYQTLQLDTSWLFEYTEHTQLLLAHLDCPTGEEFLQKYPNRATWMNSKCRFVLNIKRDLTAIN